MTQLVPDKDSAAAELSRWHQAGVINQGAESRAWQLAAQQGRDPSEQWFERISVLGLYLGALCLGAGIIFFFAYNWASLHHFAKFALVEGAMAFTLLGLYFLDRKRIPLAAGALLLLLDLLVGALLALFGQVYQTGADPWQLFAFWAAFSLIPAIAWRSDTLWCAFVVQFNLALWLHFSELGRFFFLRWEFEAMLLAVACANLGLHLLLDNGRRLKLAYLEQKVADGLLLTIGTATLTLYGCVKALGNVLGPKEGFSGIGQVSLGLILLSPAVYFYYRRLQTHPLALALWGFGAIAVISSILSRLMLDGRDPVGGFILIGAFIIGASSGLAVYLRKLMRTDTPRQQGESD